MKKILIVLAVAAIGCVSALNFEGKKISLKKTHSNKEFRVLLNKPSVDENAYDYTLLEDFQKGKNKETSDVDFISSIDKADKNPYNDMKYSDIYNGYTQGNKDYSNLNLLARLIASEAENQPYLGKLAVGSVVMNRCRINNNTVSETIYAPGQFDGINTAQFSKEPSKEDIDAAQAVLAGTNVLPDAYYYANLKLCDPSFATEKKFSVRIGDHWFFQR